MAELRDGDLKWSTMSRRHICAATAALALVPAIARSDTDAPLPGYWELSNTWVFVFHFKTVDRKCFTAADIGSVLHGPSNAHYTCTYPVRQVGDGRLNMSGSCVETHGQVAQIKAEGTYEPTAFQLKAELKTQIAGIPLSGTGYTVAHRLSEACPAEPPKAQAHGGD
jgi:hypothetical protein